MRCSSSRFCAVFLSLLLIVPAPTWAAISEAYSQGFQRYDAGDYKGAAAVLEDASTRTPDDELLLGLARLRLDEPGAAAEAWARFIRRSTDRRLAEEVSRMRTILVREANRRAARQAATGGRTPAASKDVVAVLPFRNVGETRFEPLGTAIAAMLSDSLSAVPTSRVVGQGRVQAFLEAVRSPSRGDTATARRVGRLLGAGMVVVGAHVDTASDPAALEIDSALLDTQTGDRTETGSFLAPLDRFYVAVRDTAVSLSTQLGWPLSALPAASAARVQKVHTESLDAALAFGRGLQQQDRGDAEAARREYEAALRADRSFTLARRQLATLPAAFLSLPAVAAAVQSELPIVVPPPAVLAAAASPEPTAEPSPEPSVEPSPEPSPVAPVIAARPLPTARPPARPVASEVPASDEEEETTILGMSPLTAGLVGGGLAIAIGGAAAALGGGGGGGGDNGGGNTPVPPTISGVEDRTVTAGELIVLNVEGQDPEGSTVTLSQAGAPATATFESTSGNPATGTFRWQTTTADAGQTAEVTFRATASRGPPNDTATATATLRVLAAPPTPTPPPSCGGTGASCTEASECCQDIPRGCEDTPAGGGLRCCLGLTTACQIDGDCCGTANACRGGQCCAPLGVACGAASECCDDGAACTAGLCCLPDGQSCSADADCCDGRCEAGVCEGTPPPTPTPSPSPSPTPPMCVERGGACDAFFDCCPGNDCDQTPDSSQTLCCAPLGTSCGSEGECCGTGTGCDDVCCMPPQSACSDATDCCGIGAGCVLGRCCVAPGGVCSSSQDCCAGSCVGGTCSSALSADASLEPTPRPTPSPEVTPTPTVTAVSLF